MEFFAEAFNALNLPVTILLGLVMLYWVISLLGVIDFEFLDGLADLDPDVEVDADTELETDSARTSGGGILHSVLNFLNATDVPLLFVISLIVLCLWVLNLVGNHYLNPESDALIASGVTVGSLIGAVFLTKFLTRPLTPLMRSFKISEEHQEPIVGREGVVRSSEVSQTYGQVEVASKGAPLLLHARVGEGRAPIPKGEKIIVIAKQENGGAYLVRSLEEKTS